MCACERRRVIAQPRGARPRGPAVVARESQPGPPHLDGSRDDAGSRFKKVIRAPALQAVRLVWVPRTSRSATPKRPFVGNKNDVAFSVPDTGSGRLCTVLFFGVPTKMQLTPRSLATNSSGSSKSYRTGRASPLLDDEMRISEKRADAVLAHQQRGSRKRSSASARQKTSFASSTTRVKEIFFAFRLVKNPA